MTLSPLAKNVTLALALVTCFSSTAWSAKFRIELKEDARVVSSRTIDSAKSNAAVTVHGKAGLAIEVKDVAASCGVFLQAEKAGQTTVMVSLIQADGEVDAKIKSAVSKSALLTKKDLAPSEQTVFPGAAGVRNLVVDAPALGRSCKVSLI